MAVANVCARTGRVVLKGSAAQKPIFNRKSIRQFFFVRRFANDRPGFLLSSARQPSPAAGSSGPSWVRFRTTSAATDVAESANRDGEFKDRYIPMTRKTLIQHLLQENDFLTDEEKKQLDVFSFALDGAIVSRHEGLLSDLKTLFDPINPDKDTIDSRRFNRRERLDNEFWLLQKLSTIMERANYHELPTVVVEQALRQHNIGGVKVSIHPEKYDVIRLWAVGRTAVRPPHAPWYRLISDQLKSSPSGKSVVDYAHYYKRVVVAVRMKKDDRLFLKAFKEIAVDRLDQLFPAGSYEMSGLDRRLMFFSGGLTIGGVLAKFLTDFMKIQANWTLLVAGGAAVAGARLWTSYKNKQQLHLAELSKTLYFKNIINNRGLLSLLLDKAEDEIFKEILLTYIFLLTTRPPSAREKGSNEQTTIEHGSMTSSLLENKVGDWIHVKTGSPIQFNSSEAIQLLGEFGLLTKDAKDNLNVLPLKSALRALPPRDKTLTLTSRIEEYDLVEGFELERSVHDESEEDYNLVERLRKRVGWF